MPSPIAHGSMIVFSEQVLGEAPPRDLRGVFVWGMILFAALAPDFDIPINMLIDGGNAFGMHGSYSHSLVLAPVFGALFLGVIVLMWREASKARVFALGTGLYAVHVLMDLITMDSRGVSLFWPIFPERIACPIAVFVGVEHSEYWRIDQHLLTLVTEGLYAAAMFYLSRYLLRLRRGYRIYA